jgi:poly(3-hydroxybutyrate) depolymerase
MSAGSTGWLRPIAEQIDRQRRFLREVVGRPGPEPNWTTRNEVILRHPAYRLRDFGGTEGGSLRPVLVVPPEVNQSYIVDFKPGQSLAAKIREAGFCRVAALDWLTATAETRDRDVDDSIASILECIEALGGRVHLIGLCQGGWESAIAAALAPAKVESLTLVAAPIDFHAGEGMIKWLSASMPMAAYRTLVALGGGVMKGEFISSGFDSLLPFDRYFLKYLSLWNHLDEKDWMERFRDINDWYRSPKDLAGPMYLRCVRELFKENRLIQGRLEVLGRKVDLSAIKCPLALVAGKRDHITPPPQVWAAERVVGSGRTLRVETPGGHVGSFMGRRELNEFWPGLLDWLRSGEEAS